MPFSLALARRLCRSSAAFSLRGDQQRLHSVSDRHALLRSGQVKNPILWLTTHYKRRRSTFYPSPPKSARPFSPAFLASASRQTPQTPASIPGSVPPKVLARCKSSGSFDIRHAATHTQSPTATGTHSDVAIAVPAHDRSRAQSWRRNADSFPATTTRVSLPPGSTPCCLILDNPYGPPARLRLAPISVDILFRESSPDFTPFFSCHQPFYPLKTSKNLVVYV